MGPSDHRDGAIVPPGRPGDRAALAEPRQRWIGCASTPWWSWLGGARACTVAEAV
jgi:hypothetical protein